MPIPFCSIVICTYNREKQLKKCLQSLHNLHYPKEKCEIIVVNDGSTDNTRYYLSQIKTKRFRVIHHNKNRGISCARNTGIANTTHNLIAFTDDDCVVDKNWLSRITKTGRLSQSDIVFGKTHYMQKNNTARFPEKIVSISRWPGAGNILYKKEVFEKAGGFDSVFDAYHNEDSEMAIRAVAHDFSFSYEPQALCFHQQSFWTSKTLFASAKNASVWPILKKKYPNHFTIFSPPILFEKIIQPKEYIYLIFFPILFPILFFRFVYNGKRNMQLFVSKWPIYFLLKRYYIYKEAWKQKIVMW
ncbi:MAG: hypothetical protein CL685_00650 [Candidatus Magasanikbacteria bacterium]|nr:hypothetical protein [Candidatus Magasanikbacteria bacterium]